MLIDTNSSKGGQQTSKLEESNKLSEHSICITWEALASYLGTIKWAGEVHVGTTRWVHQLDVRAPQGGDSLSLWDTRKQYVMAVQVRARTRDRMLARLLA
eukprot:6190492-Pleurochrysis_carterae.AAC.3